MFSSPHPSPSHCPLSIYSFSLSNANIIRLWCSNIYIPFSKIIKEGDISFFYNKSDADDLTAVSNAKDIMNTIDKIREPIKSMTNINK